MQVPSPFNLEMVYNCIYLLSDSDVIVCMAHVPPNFSAEQHSDLVIYLMSITASSTPWEFQPLTYDSPVSNKFCEFVFEFNLTKLVESATHTHGNIFSLVLTNCPEYLFTCRLAISYYYTQFVDFDHIT